MSEQYAREILRRNVAQICQTIGWNGINSTPLDILVHMLEKYIQNLGTQANRYAEQFNRTEPNLHDLGLAFRDLNVEVPDLVEYTRCVPPVPPPINIEKFPKPKESNLNFLKPGSHEVVTRPMHVHEHLPPMYPEKERDTPVVAGTVEIQQNGIDNTDQSNTACPSPEISVTDNQEKPKDIFKRPPDPVSLPNSKRPRLRLEEEERTREISSVMMTMSGFLSPAREGKLPEARPPTIVSEKHYDKHKPNAHHSHLAKAPVLDKSDKKSKKNKILNGKVMKSKRKDKSHKGESSKSKDSSKLIKNPSSVMKSKDASQSFNNLIPQPKVSKVIPSAPKPILLQPAPTLTIPDPMKPLIKQELLDLPPPVKSSVTGEEAIPVPRKIPISKSPLIANSAPVHKSSTISSIQEIEIKKEIIAEEEKLASQPDRSKINIFKRISNKSKEDRSAPEVISERAQSDAMISKMQNPAQDNTCDNKPLENIKTKSEETFVNNNDTTAVDLSKEMDLRSHEVINVDEDSLDNNPGSQPKKNQTDVYPSISVSKSLQSPHPKDVASVSPKVKKEKKHKDKKDKASKLEAKLLKKQQQQLAYEMAHTEKQSLKSSKPPKSSKPKNESRAIQMPTFPFSNNFPTMSPGRKNMMPGLGFIPNPGPISSSDYLGFNPALRGLPSSNLLTNPFALNPSNPSLIPGPSFLPSTFGAALPNTLVPMSNFPHSSRSSSVKIPPLLRRPSLEVIPVDNDDRNIHKSPVMARDKDRQDKHKSPTIPNILQKHKSKSHKEHKSLFKMPPVQPDITIELNPPKEIPRQDPPRPPPPSVPCTPTPEPIKIKPEPPSDIISSLSAEVSQPRETDVLEKKKDKSHKKEKKDKDGIKIKKKKDKKDKNKEKSEKKRDKEEKHELKEKLKKEKKEKKKVKAGDGLVPKLTLKLGSSNSNSPMPPSSPDVFKLNIKPVVKKEEEECSSLKEEPASREHSRSPELAQISALVTRPPKPPKLSKQNHVTETEGQSSSPPSGNSPPRKNRPPSSHSKYKRILIKPLSKKGHFDDDMASMSEEPALSQPTSQGADKPSGTLPTPYYVDEHGNKIWVCPACGRPDNGSPMIGCDGCDGWYHWVCVGITEEPGATEDWFCKSCLAKRTAMTLAGVTSGKKRGRKPKGEKIRDCH